MVCFGSLACSNAASRPIPAVFAGVCSFPAVRLLLLPSLLRHPNAPRQTASPGRGARAPERKRSERQHESNAVAGCAFVLRDQTKTTTRNKRTATTREELSDPTELVRSLANSSAPHSVLFCSVQSCCSIPFLVASHPLAWIARYGAVRYVAIPEWDLGANIFWHGNRTTNNDAMRSRGNETRENETGHGTPRGSVSLSLREKSFRPLANNNPPFCSVRSIASIGWRGRHGTEKQARCHSGTGSRHDRCSFGATGGDVVRAGTRPDAQNPFVCRVPATLGLPVVSPLGGRPIRVSLYKSAVSYSKQDSFTGPVVSDCLIDSFIHSRVRSDCSRRWWDAAPCGIGLGGFQTKPSVNATRILSL